MDEIHIFELKRIDLRDAVVIDGFPSVGLVSTITANYLISTLNLEQIGILDSVHFPTVSVVRNSEPLNPVRIYAGERISSEEGSTRIVVFISEFQPPPNLIKMIASTMLDWMQEQGCKLLISPEGLVIDRDSNAEAPEEESDDNGSDIENVDAFGIGSTPRARELLEEHEIQQFQEGVISGVAGVLLNEGKRREFDVVSILAEARPNYPDARAAARVIEAINKILFQIHIDVKPLYREAEGIEGRIKTMQKVAKTRSKEAPAPHMYG